MLQIPSIIMLSAAAAIIAVAGFLIVHRVVKPIDLGEHQGFLDAMLSIVGTLVSILLGLLVAASLDHYQTLEQSVDTEAAAIGQVYRMSEGLPKDVGERIQTLCKEYNRQVVHDEWPAMARGEYSHKVLVIYAKMLREIVTYEPQTNGKTNLHNSLLSSVQQIADSRRQRLLSLHSAWRDHLMPVLLMCSAIVLAFAYLYVRRGAVLHGILICFVAIALGGNLGLVFLLSNPFSGDWQIRPRSFELNAQVLKEIQNSSELKDVTDINRF